MILTMYLCSKQNAETDASARSSCLQTAWLTLYLIHWTIIMPQMANDLRKSTASMHIRIERLVLNFVSARS